MPTPHNEAPVNGIAKTVLMPGDPRRSEFIAETFLEHRTLVNNVRGVMGITGTWKDVPVTVMASGMGIPSIGIYSWELYKEYDVDNIIRVGSAGGLQDNLKLLDVIAAKDAVKALGIDVHIGNILSSDNFYSAFDAGTEQNNKWKQMGVLGIEMEAAGLYANAAYFGKRALCICTVSDHLYRPEMLAAEERQLGFSQMITIALDTAAKMEELRLASLG